MKRKPKPPPDGYFQSTVGRHLHFMVNAGAKEETILRFVTPDGREWIPASSYLSDDIEGVLWVDIEPGHEL